MMLRSLIIGCVLMLGVAACGDPEEQDRYDRHKGDSTDVTPAPTPSGYSNQTGTYGGSDTAEGSRNNPAGAAANGSGTDTAGSRVGGIRNMGNDTASSRTIDTGRSGAAGSGGR